MTPDLAERLREQALEKPEFMHHPQFMLLFLCRASGEDDKRTCRIGKKGTDGNTRFAIHFNTMHTQYAEWIVMVGIDNAIDFVERGGSFHGITGCFPR